MNGIGRINRVGAIDMQACAMCGLTVVLFAMIECRGVTFVIESKLLRFASALGNKIGIIKE